MKEEKFTALSDEHLGEINGGLTPLVSPNADINYAEPVYYAEPVKEATESVIETGKPTANLIQQDITI